MTIRTRIAPSPTGNDIHIGNLYTALINWTVAQQAKKNDPATGQFIIRIEDTDRTRLVEGSEANILTSLASFGLKSDENPIDGGPHAPYRQSERLDLYKKYAHELVEKGAAYFSFASKEQLEEMREEAKKFGSEKAKELASQSKNAGEFAVAVVDGMTLMREHLKTMLRDPAVAAFTTAEAEARLVEAQLANPTGKPEYTIRMLIPESKQVSFTDLIRGEITFNTNQVDDQVLLKSDGFPTYHLAVVVDDVAMKISHIIRAEEWINSTPKHVLLYDAFGWERPVFAHVPILRNPDKSKLSKRKNPVWAHWYIEQGYLPEAVLNYLALMGWSHPEEKEIFPLDEYVRVFKLEDISPVGPVFDIKKLEWMNGMYIRGLSVDELTDKLIAFYEEFGGDVKFERDFVTRTVPLVQERIKLLSEYAGYVSFLRERPTEYEMDLGEFADVLPKVAERLESVKEWKAEVIGEAMLALAAELEIKNSKFFGMLRIAITGKKVSPPLNESMEILEQEECVRRVRINV